MPPLLEHGLSFLRREWILGLLTQLVLAVITWQLCCAQFGNLAFWEQLCTSTTRYPGAELFSHDTNFAIARDVLLQGLSVAFIDLQNAIPFILIAASLLVLLNHKESDFFHLGCGLLFFALIISRILQFHFGSDDAFVDYRMADNWMHLRSFDYNRGEHILGFSSYPYVLILASVSWCVRAQPAQVAPWVNIVLQALTFVVLVAFSRRRFRSPSLALIAGASFALSPYLMREVWTGKESSLVVLLLAVAIWCLHFRRWHGLTWTCAVLAITRPEGIFALLLACIYGARQLGRRFAMRAVGPLFCVAAWYAFLFLYFGSVTPYGGVWRKFMYFRSNGPDDMSWGMFFSQIATECSGNLGTSLFCFVESAVKSLLPFSVWAVHGHFVAAVLTSGAVLYAVYLLGNRRTYLRFLFWLFVLVLTAHLIINPWQYSWYGAWFALLPSYLVPYVISLIWSSVSGRSFAAVASGAPSQSGSLTEHSADQQSVILPRDAGGEETFSTKATGTEDSMQAAGMSDEASLPIDSASALSVETMPAGGGNDDQAAAQETEPPPPLAGQSTNGSPDDSMAGAEVEESEAAAEDELVPTHVSRKKRCAVPNFAPALQPLVRPTACFVCLYLIFAVALEEPLLFQLRPWLGAHRLLLYEKAASAISRLARKPHTVASLEPGVLGYYLREQPTYILDLSGVLSAKPRAYFPVPSNERLPSPLWGAIPVDSILEQRPDCVIFFDCFGAGLLRSREFLSTYKLSWCCQADVWGSSALYVYEKRY